MKTVADHISIRKAEESDRVDVEFCFDELQAFELSIEPNRLDPALIRSAYVDRIYRMCEQTGGAIFVAEVDGRIVGFVSIWSRVESPVTVERDRYHAYVTDLVVLQDFRGKGVGSRLMEVAEAHARTSGAKRIRLSVLAENFRAHVLYKRLGYRDLEVVLEKIIEGGR